MIMQSRALHIHKAINESSLAMREAAVPDEVSLMTITLDIYLFFATTLKEKGKKLQLMAQKS